MKKRFMVLLTLLAIWLSYAVPVFSQEGMPQEDSISVTPPAPDSLDHEPVDPIAITEAFTASNNLISEADKKHFTEAQLTSFAGEMDALIHEIDRFLKDSLLMNVYVMDASELSVIIQRADYHMNELERLQNRLRDLSEELKETTSSLSEDMNQWILVLKNTPEEEIPRERIARIGQITSHLDSIRTLLLADMGRILNEQDRLSDKMNELSQLKEEVNELKDFLDQQLFSIEMPGLLDHLFTRADTAMVQKHLDQIRGSFRADNAILKSKYKYQSIGAGILLLILISFNFWFKGHFKRTIAFRKFEISKTHLAFIHSPLVTSIFITGALIRFILPDLPRTFHSLNFVLFMIPMLVIVVRIFSRELRTWFLLLIILYTLTFFYELTYDPDILMRMVLLVFSLTALGLFGWLYFKNPPYFQFRNRLVKRLLRILLLILNILLVVAVIANFLGAFSLAEFFTLIPIQIVLLAVGVQIATKIVDTIIFLWLASKQMQKFNVVKDDFNIIYRKTVWVLDLLLWIFFFTMSLSIFRLREPFYLWGRKLLTNGIQIGAVEITIASILLFIFVIWLSIIFTRIIRHILEKDVFSRVKTAKGVPTTVVLLVRISLLSAGFFLAAAAAGITLTNLSIVLGAFSVGIGFGLQNIFNNMVSGLILAMERPIKVGDVVQVGDLIGVVKSIGFRASNVKSFDGAEVIVPNGNLISNEMINWTLSDSNRRLDIRVGVAYGTKPSKVVELMQKVAENHPKVDKKPPPTAYFIGFGNSSLDFRLLAWTDIDSRLQVESELNMEIQEILEKEGIEVPFPQLDLHIRSDQSKARK